MGTPQLRGERGILESSGRIHKLVEPTMRYLLDTNIMLFLLNDSGDLSSDVEAIIADYGNSLHMSAASVRELVAAWHKYPRMQRKWKTASEMLSFLDEQYNIEVAYPQREHYAKFVQMDWNEVEDHRDTTDILIIAHAITEGMTLISADRKFPFYRRQGLKLLYNER